MTFAQSRLDTFFMCRCSLSSADYVGILSDDKADAVQEPGSSRASMRLIGMCPRLLSFLLETRRSNVVKVLQDVDDHGDVCRYFEHTCIRYVYDEKSHRFRPRGKLDNVSGISAHDILRSGGTPASVVKEYLHTIGNNEMNVEVPSVLRSLWAEFFDYVHIFQMFGVWNYVGYSSPNLSLVWFVMLVGSGVWKALWIVRQNQINIREMAVAGGNKDQIVLRDGKWVHMVSSKLVLGDIVQVSPGPAAADLIVLGGSSVVNESMLTGEPMPIQKVAFSSQSIKFDPHKHGKRHAIYAGTEVMQSQAPAITPESEGEIEWPSWASCNGSNNRAYPSAGKAVGLVIAVAGQTTKGQLVRMVLFPSAVKFKYTQDLPIVYGLLILWSVVSSVVILIMRGSQRGFAWWFFTTCSLITETLNPMLGVSIARGQSVCSGRLKAKGTTCLSLGRIPMAGKISVMVFDKTGTITHGGMELHSVAPIGSIGESSAEAVFQKAIEPSMLMQEPIGEELLHGMASCHTVTTLSSGELVGNAVEVSQVQATGWKLPRVESKYKSIKSPDGNIELEILRALEFDHCRMTSGAIVRISSVKEAKLFVFIKGAYDKILQIVMPRSVPSDYSEKCDSYAGKDCFYVLAMSCKELPASTSKAEISCMSRDDLESDLRLCGLLLFRNEMKPDSAQVIASIKMGKIRCVMCTGDNVFTGVAIARQAGIFSDDVKVLIGDTNEGGNLVWQDSETRNVVALDRCPDAELALTQSAFHNLVQRRGEADINTLLPRVRVYARMKPEDKIQVVELWQNFGPGYVTGMAGDGGNDCGALRVAHVGIALCGTSAKNGTNKHSSEASMVSPFSTSKGLSEKGYISLSGVLDLLLEGRACLETNLATFMAFIQQALIMSAPRVIVIWIGDMCWAEWHFVMIDLVLSIVAYSWIMPTCRPAEKLAPFRPSASLLGWRVICTIGITFTIYLFWLIVIWCQLVFGAGSEFYQPWDSEELDVPGLLWNKKADNHIMAVLFPFTVLWLASASFVFSYGHVHRENVFKNMQVLISYAVFILFVGALYWTPPNSFSCLFRTNCDNPHSLATGSQNFGEKIFLQPFVSFSMGDIGGCFVGPQLAYCHPSKDQPSFCLVALPGHVTKSKKFYPGWSSTEEERRAAGEYHPPFQTFAEKHAYCGGTGPPFLNASDEKYCWYPDKDKNQCKSPLASLAGDSTGCVPPHNCFSHEFTVCLTILMACSIIMFHLVYRWLLLDGPGSWFRNPSNADMPD